MTNADDRQVGGDHYRNNRDGEQHWTIMAECCADYFAGCISKYVHRFPNKNGLQDLEKAMHFIDKAMETGAGHTQYPTPAEEWVSYQHHDALSTLENSYMRLVLFNVLCTHDLPNAKKALTDLIDLYAASEPGRHYVDQD